MSNANDKFKIEETAPIFSIAPTGSYGGINSGIKSAYRIKSKDPQTGNTIKSSGIINSNLNTVPDNTPPITILKYSNNLAGENFRWSGVTWTLDNT